MASKLCELSTMSLISHQPPWVSTKQPKSLLCSHLTLWTRSLIQSNRCIALYGLNSNLLLKPADLKPSHRIAKENLPRTKWLGLISINLLLISRWRIKISWLIKSHLITFKARLIIQKCWCILSKWALTPTTLASNLQIKCLWFRLLKSRASSMSQVWTAFWVSILKKEGTYLCRTRIHFRSQECNNFISSNR